MPGEPAIVHQQGEGRGKFIIELAPATYAFLTYELREGKMLIKSTYTPPEFRGKGIATRLMKRAVEWAKENNFRVVPLCSFAAHYFEKHAEDRHVLDEEYRRKLES